MDHWRPWVVGSCVALLGGCGRVDYQQIGSVDACAGAGCPDAGSARDAGREGDAGRDRDAGEIEIDAALTCADQGGLECAADSICRRALFASSDVGECCPDGDCVDRSGRLVAEALRTSTPPVIDGDISEWDGAPRWPITKVSIGTPPSSNDFSGTFAARWDDDRVYFLVEITDDILQPMQNPLPWQDDSIELYVDMDARSFDASWDDGETWCYLNQDGTVEMGTSVTDVFPSAAAFGTRVGGWYFEASIDWPIRPLPDTSIGFDVALNDRDGAPAASRANQLFWNDETGQLYRDASLLGLLRLSRSATPSGLPVCGTGSCDPGEDAASCPEDC